MGDSDEAAAAERTVVEALTAVDGADRAPAGQLLPLVYDLLRRRAHHLMDRERGAHTLTPTALVHEAYLRVADRGGGFEGRKHFYNAAALAMRRILVEHARARGRVKRGGGAAAVDLDVLEPEQPVTLDTLDWLALDEALGELARRDNRRHQVVMLRFFAGLREAEVAELLGVEERTVKRDWATARLWLSDRLSGAAAP
jgi:RNA polymerase sigma factor (TIGR02999 family)